MMDSMSKYLSGFPWEAFLTVQTGKIDDEQRAYEAIQAEVIRPLSKYLNTTIGGIGVHNRLKNPHAHILLFSKHGNLSKLFNLNPYRLLCSPSNEIVTRVKSIDIKPYQNEGAINYLLANLPERSGKGGFVWFGRRLLERVGKGEFAA